MENEDKEIVERVINGEVGLFELLVKKYENGIVGFIYKIVLNYEDAVELAQETFIKLYSSLDKYDPKFKFSTWLFTIAKNKTIDFLRSNKYENNFDDSRKIKPNRFSDITKNPEEELLKNEFYEKVILIIDELPIEYKEVITLRYLNNFSYNEISEITDLPLGTVKNRIFRAKILIREIFEKKFGKI